jgi:hypothetical protein
MEILQFPLVNSPHLNPQLNSTQLNSTASFGTRLSYKHPTENTVFIFDKPVYRAVA